MIITEITWRHRNDFHFVAHCRNCGANSRWGDGYADAFYQRAVFPARHCPQCGMNEHGEMDDRQEARLEAGRVDVCACERADVLTEDDHARGCAGRELRVVEEASCSPS